MYVDDTGIATQSIVELIAKFESVFQQIQQVRLKLLMPKCAFSHIKIEFSGSCLTKKSVAQMEEKIAEFNKNLKLPNSDKSLQRYYELVQYRQYIPNLAAKLVPLYKL